MALSKNLRRKWISHVKFTFYLLLGIGLFSTFMYFIGTNWEKPNLNPAKPAASESARQELAIDSARIAAGAKKLGLTELSTLADTWTNDLGGVWAPWPEGAPAGYKNPGLDLSAKSATVPELVAELTLFARTLADKGTAFAPPPAMIDFASKVFIQADQLARMHSLPQALPEVALPQVASLINDAQTVVELESTKQILEAHTALLPSGQEAKRKENRKHIALLGTCINLALSAGVDDERSTFTPPNTDLSQAKQLLFHSLSTLAQKNDTVPEAKSNPKNAGQLSPNAMLAVIIARFAPVFDAN
ncbi:hypothetical protein [Arcanobacterium hippocoleae]|uniref:Uncharacterized protein n=1 Tax=Arcanobacterium hippocoleae TaxID=149017 RepID=A0ABU1T117_9ACTO|nr:hypothetical protein [Arcanobacterium hippocoleae]MDR6939074.1 hypothetical protein [Arcanobacterium hippocoleae]